MSVRGFFAGLVVFTAGASFAFADDVLIDEFIKVVKNAKLPVAERVNACTALAKEGKSAKRAVPVIVALANEHLAWKRSEDGKIAIAQISRHNPASFRTVLEVLERLQSDDDSALDLLDKLSRSQAQFRTYMVPHPLLAGKWIEPHLLNRGPGFVEPEGKFFFIDQQWVSPLAVRALARSGSPKAVKSLLHTLKEADSPFARSIAAHGLGAMRRKGLGDQYEDVVRRLKLIAGVSTDIELKTVAQAAIEVLKLPDDEPLPADFAEPKIPATLGWPTPPTPNGGTSSLEPREDKSAVAPTNDLPRDAGQLRSLIRQRQDEVAKLTSDLKGAEKALQEASKESSSAGGPGTKAPPSLINIQSLQTTISQFRARIREAERDIDLAQKRLAESQAK